MQIQICMTYKGANRMGQLAGFCKGGPHIDSPIHPLPLLQARAELGMSSLSIEAPHISKFQILQMMNYER